jgi:hypothetical protein
LSDGEAAPLTILLEEVWERRHPAERSRYRRLSPLRASALRCRRGAGLGGRGVVERRVRVPLRARLTALIPLPAGAGEEDETQGGRGVDESSGIAPTPGLSVPRGAPSSIGPVARMTESIWPLMLLRR